MELMALSTKVCSKCGRELSASEFYPHRRECKSCESLRKKEWHKKNSERLSKKYKERYYKNKEAVAELDRLIPDKGYVKGNVHWISRRANRIKSDATVEELEKIISYMKDNDGE